MSRTLLIKPASASCDMACRYCFYADESANRTTPNYGMMSEETAEKLIERAFEDNPGHVAFGFQGGEPTCRGLSFFRFFVEKTKEKAGKNTFSFSLQTNGLSANAEWAEFYKENGFLVGVSVDGPKKVHDEWRLDKAGRGTFQRVFNNAKLLDSKGVPVNILVTVTKQAAKNPVETWDFFKRNGFRHLQFIPCIDPMNKERGGLPWSTSPSEYGVFLQKLFALYHRDWSRGDYTSVRHFDNLISLAVRGWAEECGRNGMCGKYFLIEADGSCYPCDFYALDKWRLGNLWEMSFGEMDGKRRKLGFVEQSLIVHEDCMECRWRPLCRGGCRRDREDFATGEIEKTYLCPAYKAFFEKCAPGIMEIAEAERRAIGTR